MFVVYHRKTSLTFEHLNGSSEPKHVSFEAIYHQ